MVFAHDVANKILLSDSNCIVDGLMLQMFDNSRFSMREVIVTSVI